jgi:hypothetical protein
VLFNFPEFFRRENKKVDQSINAVFTRCCKRLCPIKIAKLEGARATRRPRDLFSNFSEALLDGRLTYKNLENFFEAQGLRSWKNKLQF